MDGIRRSSQDLSIVGPCVKRVCGSYGKPNVAIFNIAIFIQFSPYPFNLIFKFIQFNPRSFNSIPTVILFNPYSFNSIFRSIQFNFCILYSISLLVQFNFCLRSMAGLQYHAIKNKYHNHSIN